MEFKNSNFVKIKYGEKEYFIIDFFEYKGKKYYYIMEDIYEEGKDNIEDYGNKEVEVNFIYEVEDKYYQTVDDDQLYKELSKEATKRIFLQENKYFKGLYDNLKK